MTTALEARRGATANEIKTVTRQQLYELVWATPMRTLAKEFGMSDVRLAKVCRRYDIPRPPPGYWAMIQAGKKVERPALRQNIETDGLNITFSSQTNESVDEALKPQPVHRDQ